jgi:hypothetical protein
MTNSDLLPTIVPLNPAHVCALKVATDDLIQHNNHSMDVVEEDIDAFDENPWYWAGWEALPTPDKEDGE